MKSWQLTLSMCSCQAVKELGKELDAVHHIVYKVDRLEDFLIAPCTPEKCVDETGEQDYDYVVSEGGEGVKSVGGAALGISEAKDVLDEYDDDELYND